MKYYLGIDGGGTTTVAAVSDENGNILLKQAGKSINFYSVGMDAARFNLENVLVEIDAVSGIKEFESAFIGCSALDGEADEELVGKLCGGIVKAKKIRMNSDVYIALKSVGEAECPCVAVCGTGSMAVAEDKQGNIRISGGWGHIVGDEGSAYSIAVNALKCCCRMCDRGEETPLLSSANRFFGVENFRDATDIIYSSQTTKDILAGFAKNVGELAEDGDADALEIIRTEAKAFSRTVLDLLDGCDVLGLYGGVFRHNELFTSVFSAEIKEKYPTVCIKLLDTPAEEGALILARKL
ncbi:MAG: hypothetical protein IJZ35_06715 [Clostridia bacterium]|nr:hypothetical protein [Clostridia bacterium]